MTGTDRTHPTADDDLTYVVDPEAVCPPSSGGRAAPVEWSDTIPVVVERTCLGVRADSDALASSLRAALRPYVRDDLGRRPQANLSVVVADDRGRRRGAGFHFLRRGTTAVVRSRDPRRVPRRSRELSLRRHRAAGRHGARPRRRARARWRRDGGPGADAAMARAARTTTRDQRRRVRRPAVGVRGRRTQRDRGAVAACRARSRRGRSDRGVGGGPSPRPGRGAGALPDPGLGVLQPGAGPPRESGRDGGAGRVPLPGRGPAGARAVAGHRSRT